MTITHLATFTMSFAGKHYCFVSYTVNLERCSITFLEPEMVRKLYKALVWPILEYSNPASMGTYFYSGPKKN